MANTYRSPYNVFDSPTLDAGLGLVYRLNLLWQRGDEAANNGDFMKWNAILDSILRNLLYRNPLEITRNQKQEIIDVTFNLEDKELFDYLNKKYYTSLKSWMSAKTKFIRMQKREEIYLALTFKDVGLRKYMFKLKLYLKEHSANPAKAMSGG